MKGIQNGFAANKFGVYYRIPKKGISYTVVNVTKSMMIHPTLNRRLTVHEAGILQTFPPTFDFQGTIAEMGNQVGNAVPPKFAEFIGIHIAEQLINYKSIPKQSSLDSFTQNI